MQGISNHDALGVLDASLHEFIVDRLVDVGSGASDAALATVAKQDTGLTDGKIKISVRTYYIGRFSAQLESDGLEVVLVRVAHDDVAYFS